MVLQHANETAGESGAGGDTDCSRRRPAPKIETTRKDGVMAKSLTARLQISVVNEEGLADPEAEPSAKISL
jgi:hypothetical protein